MPAAKLMLLPLKTYFRYFYMLWMVKGAFFLFEVLGVKKVFERHSYFISNLKSIFNSNNSINFIITLQNSISLLN
jgi:hypothetical protein